jgi:hypothetical protein
MLLRGDNLEVKLRTPIKDRVKRVVFAGATGAATGSASASVAVSAPALPVDDHNEDSLSSRFSRFTEDAGKNLLSYFESDNEPGHSNANVGGVAVASAAAPAPLPPIPSRQGNASYYSGGEKPEDVEEAAAAERKRDKLMRMASNLVKK